VVSSPTEVKPDAPGYSSLESFTGHLGRQPHREVETKRGDFENWSAIGCGIEELKGHNCLLVTNMPRTRLFVGIVEDKRAPHEGVGNPRLAVRSVHWVSPELKVGKPPDSSGPHVRDHCFVHMLAAVGCAQHLSAGFDIN